MKSVIFLHDDLYFEKSSSVVCLKWTHGISAFAEMISVQLGYGQNDSYYSQVCLFFSI